MTLRPFALPETTCPECGTVVTHAGMDPTANRGRGPQPGDYAMCVRCLALGTYDAGMRLTRFDMTKLSTNDRAQIEEIRAYLKAKRD